MLDLPAIPPSANEPNLQGGLPLSEVLSLGAGERALALTHARHRRARARARHPRRHRQAGQPRGRSARDEWEVIGLKDGDEVVGAVELATGEETLCFIASDAQLLHFSASLVRPQGRAGGGMAGIKLGPRATCRGSACRRPDAPRPRSS